MSKIRTYVPLEDYRELEQEIEKLKEGLKKCDEMLGIYLDGMKQNFGSEYVKYEPRNYE